MIGSHQRRPNHDLTADIYASATFQFHLSGTQDLGSAPLIWREGGPTGPQVGVGADVEFTQTAGVHRFWAAASVPFVGELADDVVVRIRLPTAIGESPAGEIGPIGPQGEPTKGRQKPTGDREATLDLQGQMAPTGQSVRRV